MDSSGIDRIIGLDLGVTSAHSAVVLDARGQILARRRVSSTVASLGELERIALRETDPGSTLTVVIEPTGPMWLPIAVYFGRRGHTVVRVSSAKAADLRRFLSRHAKSNGIDAETLARMPILAPAGLHPVELSGAERASLDRRVRTVARLTREIGQRKVRIRALAQTLIPTIGDAFGDGLNRTDLAVLERYADPRTLIAAGPARLARLVHTESRGKLGPAKVEALRRAARDALELWADDTAIALDDLAEEIQTEIRLLRLAEPNAPAMNRPAIKRCTTSTRKGSPTACPAWGRSAPANSWQPWAGRVASATPQPSSPSPAWRPRPARPATPTAKVSR